MTRNELDIWHEANRSCRTTARTTVAQLSLANGTQTWGWLLGHDRELRLGGGQFTGLYVPAMVEHHAPLLRNPLDGTSVVLHGPLLDEPGDGSYPLRGLSLSCFRSGLMAGATLSIGKIDPRYPQEGTSIYDEYQAVGQGELRSAGRWQLTFRGFSHNLQAESGKLIGPKCDVEFGGPKCNGTGKTNMTVPRIVKYESLTLLVTSGTLAQIAGAPGFSTGFAVGDYLRLRDWTGGTPAGQNNTVVKISQIISTGVIEVEHQGQLTNEGPGDRGVVREGYVDCTVQSLDPVRSRRVITVTAPNLPYSWEDHYVNGRILATNARADSLNAGVARKVRVCYETDRNGTSMELMTWDSWPYEVEVGDTFRLTPGCTKRTEEDCRVRWSNLESSRGVGTVPSGDKLTDGGVAQ